MRNTATSQSLSRVLAKTEVPETILVVEDDVLVRMPISQYLRDCGYKVIEAANADEAMTVLLHKETVIDIVFTDIEMPGTLDEFGLARWVRNSSPGVDVILAGTLPRTVDWLRKCLLHRNNSKVIHC